MCKGILSPSITFSIINHLLSNINQNYMKSATGNDIREVLTVQVVDIIRKLRLA